MTRSQRKSTVIDDKPQNATHAASESSATLATIPATAPLKPLVTRELLNGLSENVRNSDEFKGLLSVMGATDAMLAYKIAEGLDAKWGKYADYKTRKDYIELALRLRGHSTQSPSVTINTQQLNYAQIVQFAKDEAGRRGLGLSGGQVPAAGVGVPREVPARHNSNFPNNLGENIASNLEKLDAFNNPREVSDGEMRDVGNEEIALEGASVRLERVEG